jgi:hypothetical protein
VDTIHQKTKTKKIYPGISHVGHYLLVSKDKCVNYPLPIQRTTNYVHKTTEEPNLKAKQPYAVVWYSELVVLKTNKKDKASL